MLVAALSASTVDGNTVRSERLTLRAPAWLHAWLAWLGADGGRERARAAGRRFGGPVRRAAACVRLWLRPGGGPRRSARPGWTGQPTPPRQPKRYRQAGGDAAARSRKRHRRGPALRQCCGSFRCCCGSLRQRGRPSRQCCGSLRERKLSFRHYCGSFRQRRGSLRERKLSFRHCRGSLRQRRGSLRERKLSFRHCRGSLRQRRGSLREPSSVPACRGSFRQRRGSLRERKLSFRHCRGSLRQCCGSFWQCGRSLRQCGRSFQQCKRPIWECCGSFQPRQRPHRGCGSRPQAGRAWGRRRGTPRQARRRGEGLGPDT